ncbi:protein of unknown function [Methanoculleus bourgensis]|uniref:Uncharacterized protein n=1 Tax=Methanoculleus bourgensis TaxID=83986 RepID=A0A0X3BJW7_9EURY|nr:protein of unknown function [Methanoculleus bourgensis]
MFGSANIPDPGSMSDIVHGTTRVPAAGGGYTGHGLPRPGPMRRRVADIILEETRPRYRQMGRKGSTFFCSGPESDRTWLKQNEPNYPGTYAWPEAANWRSGRGGRTRCSATASSAPRSAT